MWNVALFLCDSWAFCNISPFNDLKTITLNFLQPCYRKSSRTAMSRLMRHEAVFGFQIDFKFWALLWIEHSLWIYTVTTLLITVSIICKHFDIFVHSWPRKLRILWPVLLLVHDPITVTLCNSMFYKMTDKKLQQTAANSESCSTNCLWSRSTAAECSAAMSQPALATCLL